MTKPLTKSLHTVSAAVNVAGYLKMQSPDHRNHDAQALADCALLILGQYDDARTDANDATLAMIVKQIRKTGLAS